MEQAAQGSGHGPKLLEFKAFRHQLALTHLTSTLLSKTKRASVWYKHRDSMIKHRALKAPPGQHRHCERCFSRHCRAPIETSVSCMVISCHLHCGATFHMCKQEEHQLLCPLEHVPCLNAHYGCPFSMARFKLAKHLQICPASVVCCSMEWNRWPNVDSDTTLHKNIMKESLSEECLDTALALRDQKILFRNLKVADLFPEWRKKEEVGKLMEEAMDGIEGAVGGLACGSQEGSDQFSELSQSERENLAKDKEGMDLGSYKTWENIFSKELLACQVTGSATSAGKKKEEASKQKASSSCTAVSAEKAKEVPCNTEEAKDQKPEQTANKEMTGLAPWQEGVLERLKKEVGVGDYNMYLVHHGGMLIRFGQMAACTPKEKDFVYGNLEAQEVKTVYTFKVPVSYCGKRARLGDVMAHKIPTSDKSVDTSELGINPEELPKADVVTATLLCALEKELKGHEISEARGIDGLFVDFGTQTYNFPLEPFSCNAVLADIVDESSQPELHVELYTESVTRRHNKSSSAFTFTCNHFFRRDEYASHFKNVHADIQSCLDGWFQLRCPLAYLGCTFVQNHFRPDGHKAKVIYSKLLNTFAIKPEVDTTLAESEKCNFKVDDRGRTKDLLSSLPLEVLKYIAGFLDSFSLSQLSQVSVLMRDICATLLQERGMVLLVWEKKRYSHGGTSWKARRKKWQFSSLFSRVDRWQLSDMVCMSEHLKECPFYKVERKTDPVLLTGMCETPQQVQKTLVSTFKCRV
ncbi:F-box only protein 40 [Tympanuchus pallidicinctus]|uniref:F-box only protein 40 n=1 Tax=Tympanuchus pallidicinctus TaxID=109042 RepID=UPI0022873ABF|nr:F-box only protein 40 [Tympanuchus pallidicinctus]